MKLTSFMAVLGIVALTGCASSRSVEHVGTVDVYTFRRAYSNAHLVRAANGSTILVDSGYAAEADGLDADLRDAGFDPAALKAIVLTHGHADHAGGALHFQHAYHTKLVAGAGDRAMLAAGRNDKLCPTGDASRLEADQNATFASTVADVWVDGPADLEPLIGFSATVVPMPSHTPGSLAVLVSGAAIVGDLFRGAIVGDTAEEHFYMCDRAFNRADISRLLHHLAPDATTFFVGHFGPVARSAVAVRFP